MRRGTFFKIHTSRRARWQRRPLGGFTICGKRRPRRWKRSLWTIHGASTFSIGLTEPPAWPWGCPWINTFQGLQGALSFNAGINASTLSNFPAVGIIYPFPYHIGIGQLDSKNWDTSTFPPRRKV